MSKLSEEEKSLFADAMQGVKPLKGTERVTAYQPEQVKKRSRETLRQLRNKQYDPQLELPELRLADSLSPVGAFESMLYHRKGIRLQDLSRLKKGEYPVDGQLDLHGMTEDKADQALQLFVERSYQSGKRCLIVVHGKGYNSETSAPVLKNLVNRRLRQLKSVLAFCSTLPKDGGTGSVYVLLKSR
ncbi:Smr/MutS family protein [Thiomicrorhabdus sp. zzn3]|uniref:Smr/MutS family protein n=1 Tax=Thiomicrorhabdus sp. zzn3 TaxID=3039775 RepID=UPI002436FD21|nr:Smr/MutS family protein [Thiomicrorhabdus sp. zzn3]MDG6778005.1 Smr/MutS family protein [Thiomicrorhabdus sp. zzn3]